MSDLICFPNNVCEMLRTALQTIDDDLSIVLRPVNNMDRTNTVSITPSSWVPEQSSMELGNHEPTFQRYSIVIETLIVDMDEERAIADHSLLSSRVRLTLYRDPGIRAGLPLLTVSDGGYVERLKRWGVREQRFLNNKVDANFVYLSAVDLWFETEIEST